MQIEKALELSKLQQQRMVWNKFSGVQEELLVFAFVVRSSSTLACPINSHSLKNNFQLFFVLPSEKEKTIKFYVFFVLPKSSPRETRNWASLLPIMLNNITRFHHTWWKYLIGKGSSPEKNCCVIFIWSRFLSLRPGRVISLENKNDLRCLFFSFIFSIAQPATASSIETTGKISLINFARFLLAQEKKTCPANHLKSFEFFVHFWCFSFLLRALLSIW